MLSSLLIAMRMSPESNPMETTFSRRMSLGTGYDSRNLVSEMRVGLGAMDMFGKEGGVCYRESALFNFLAWRH